ncbi:Arylsulfatase A [Hyunsoonleella jejuensis]|uniref:Arylsulfatase A n=1 Tax=Hyunsoonleella jejuensis TaxID=419940 RepID=A0A1H9CDR5_9FLAO|nr:sulfatase [Hyunsoonleella jejuensis]SEP99284.1 Arylsulfatase A [Hyunsoonleella jejuensis]
MNAIKNKILKFIILLAISLNVFSCFSKKINSVNESKPNIVFILVDDLGWSDVGFMGNPVYETLNLDKLSMESVTFSNAYAPAANCAPSRACILTGKNTPRHGIYTVGSSERGKAANRKLIPTKNTKTLKEDFITLGEVLKAKGYQTATMGKWHLSDNPTTQGFDVNVGGSHAGHPKSYFSPYKNPVLEDGEDGEYLTDRLTNEAISFIESNSTKPFFLYLPYFTVHTPLQGKKDLVEKYKEKIKGDKRFNAEYGAMVESMDANVGRILEALKTLNISENTIVVFTSDNGGLASVSSQFPIRAGKGSYYEGGIRVPFVMRWPNKIKQPKKEDTPITGLDIFPTILEAVNDTKDYELDGNSILPLVLNNKPFTERSLFWHFPIYLQGVNPLKDEARDSLFRTRPGSVIRKGKWKLHEYFEDNALELYNLEADLREQEDVSEKYPNITKELHRELVAWRNKSNAPVPKELNPRYVSN